MLVKRTLKHFHMCCGLGGGANAVPPAAAEAIAHVMGTTLLLAPAGETFMLNSMPIWVRPVAVGLSVAQQGVTDV